jgi:cytochrome P450
MAVENAGTERVSEWNPLQPEDFDSAHGLYAELRERCPVPWSNEFGGFWAVTRYADLKQVTEDEDTFITSIQNTVPGIPRAERRPPLHIDPPDHAAFRKPLDRVFRQSVVARRATTFRQAADDLLDPLLAAGQGDFSTDFALPYAVRCFAEMLELAPDLMMRVREIGVRYSFAIQRMDRAQIKQTSEELYVVARDVVAGRQAAPGDPEVDLVSSLLAAMEEDSRVTYDSVVSSVRQFLAAGVGAPHAVLGSCAVHLARDGELQARLRTQPELIPAAVEELLRLYSPYRVFARTATRDVTIRDRTIAAGEAVALIFPSANRDADTFDDPHAFRIDRRPNRHLAFGRGPHKCVAAAMARLELRIGLEALLARTARFTLSGPVRMFNWLEFGPMSSPMRFEAA